MLGNDLCLLRSLSTHEIARGNDLDDNSHRELRSYNIFSSDDRKQLTLTGD